MAKVLLALLKVLIVSNSVGCNLATLLRESCKHYGNFDVILKDMTCTGTVLTVFTGQTKRQCILECLSNTQCKSLNFKEEEGHCQLLARNLTTSIGALNQNPGWMYITTEENALNVGPRCVELSPCQNGGKCVDVCSGDGFKCHCKEMFTGKYCEKERDFVSCHAAYEAGYRQNGIYLLTNIGHHYCVLTQMTGCNVVGGWTLVLKTDGRLSTFRYGSSHWTTNSVYNHVYALKEGLDGDQEAKFPAFNTLPFTKVCAGMRLGSTFHLRQSWLNILKGSTLQAYCNVQGINVIQGTVDSRVRIGILGNNENDCVTPDSGLGIGLGGAHLRGTGVSTGATMNSQQAFGYILIH
ncbi:uncharacterized protein LOC135683313 isoform X2 [Rhopilema esculentum]|uniref:uncharacterized protein LOC135683313 isoform X2 n=1 Tax=Rhopilema esculentum TaxID=499914 RepID=UPI0031D620CE